MLPNITEIVLILLIVALVFGIGKVGQLGHTAGKLKSNFQKGLSGSDDDEKDGPIDITPPKTDSQKQYDGPKPGTAKQAEEDAELVD